MPELTARPPGAPTAFRYPDTNPQRMRLRNLVKRLTGADLFPSDAVARAFIAGLNEGDPVAERFVAETYHGALGARKARDLIEKAQREGIDNVADAPESMRALFDEFEQLPDWVVPRIRRRRRRRLAPLGVCIWRARECRNQ